MLPRSHISSMRFSPNIGRSIRGFAENKSTLAPSPRGFTSASQLKANWIGWLSFISLSRFRVYWPLQTVRAFSAPGHLLCRLLTPTVRSGTITGLSVPCRHYPVGTHCRSPGVSTCACGAQPLDLRLWSLMDMDFVLSCALVRPQRLISSFCSSARTCDTRFFQTSPHGDALAFLSPSPPSGWQRDWHPPSAGTCPAHMNYPAASCGVSQGRALSVRHHGFSRSSLYKVTPEQALRNLLIDATVAPKVGFISPFGTTACNVNHINARVPSPRP